MKKSFIAKIISILLTILLLGGGVCLFFLPTLYNYFKDEAVPLFQSQTLFYQVAFIACYVICLIVVFVLIRVFYSIYKETPFQKKIEFYLKIIAILFMVLSFIVFIKSLWIPTLLSFVVVLLCFLMSLSFYVLSEVIKAAIYYKNEVDWTV